MKNININQTLGLRIQKIRVSKKITQEELADKINKSTHFISDIERGIKCPSVPTLINIMEALKTSPNEIFFDFVPTENNMLSEINKIFFNLTQIERQHLLKFLNEYKIIINDTKNKNNY